MRLCWRVLWIAALITALWLVLPLAVQYPIAHAATLETATSSTTASTTTSSASVVVGSSTVVPGIGPDCKGDPPLPASPGGLLGLRPAVTSTQDPFTTPGVSIASVYGTDYQWWWYDNGCGPGADIMPKLVTNIAGFAGLHLPGLLLAAGQGLYTAVINPGSWIGFLDKPIEHATASVAAGVWFPFLTLALLVVAVVTLVRAARGRLSGTITATVWALTVLVLVTWVVNYPSESVKLMDSGIQTAVITTANGFTHPERAAAAPDDPDGGRDAAVAAMDATWDTINRSTVYRSWLTGVFGTADSPTAARFGPSVFKATHFTWAEYDTYQRDPAGAGKAIVDRKAGEFRQLATQVQAADPIAYQFFTGNRTGERLGTALMCLFVTLVTTLFFIIAGLLTIVGYAVARLVVPVTPAAGVLFLLDSFRDVALSWGQKVVGVLVMGPVAFLTALVLLAFTNAVFTATMADGLKYLIILALSWLTWRLLRPHTAFGKMRVPGKKLIAQVVAMRLAGNAISRRGHHDNDNDDDKSDDTGGDQHGSVTSPGRRSERVVHTPAPPRTRYLPPERHEPAVEQGAAYPMIDASGRPTADAAMTYTVAARPRRPRSGNPPDVASTGQDTHAVGPDHAATPTSRAVASGGTAVDAASEAPAVVSTREQATPTAEATSPPFEVGAGKPDRQVQALPAGRDVVEGNVLEDGTKLPERVNEANLTRDEHGRVVFQVYRPEGSRFYAQDE